MLIHILIYVFATIGLINSIHYPARALYRARKPKEIEGPINIINNITFPEPYEDWQFTRIERKNRFGTRKDIIKYIFNNVCVSMGYLNPDDETDGYYNMWVKDQFVSDNKQVERYIKAIKNSYTERYALEEVIKENRLEAKT